MHPRIYCTILIASTILQASIVKTRISLIHATSLAMSPIQESFSRLWPDAMVFNLLEDSLTADLRVAGGDIDAMAGRFVELTRYAVDSGANGVLFTCSAFGAAIEAARATTHVPVLKPNEAMIEEALILGTNVALIATFEPALAPITQEFREYAQSRNTELNVKPFFVNGAWEAIQSGDKQVHDQLIAKTCAAASDFDVVCLAQFSMTSAQAASQHASGRPTLTTPDSAVKKLKARLS
jgi:Asp/Glu/hydantoin racemase